MRRMASFLSAPLHPFSLLCGAVASYRDTLHEYGTLLARVVPKQSGVAPAIARSDALPRHEPCYSKVDIDCLARA